ncbi:DNA-binding protein [Candidatus Pacearchaeota archaeon]|nr:DNA-binding protein [Candidatus Pacearchaeota archaeon]|tara:strand:- start:90 stop:629 length:540 start_codon:yes stop_codon:yes gene_type:complete
MTEKEENAIILDYLPYGYPIEKKMSPIAQAIGLKTLALLELIPRRGVTLSIKEKVYIGPEKRDKIYYIAGRLRRDRITETAKIQLQEFIEELVGEQESRFVEFFNNAPAINTRLHQLELLPGFGKKHTQEIIEERAKKAFKSFEDIRERVKSIPDPKSAIEKRVIEELLERQRFNLFAH